MKYQKIQGGIEGGRSSSKAKDMVFIRQSLIFRMGRKNKK